VPVWLAAVTIEHKDISRSVAAVLAFRGSCIRRIHA